MESRWMSLKSVFAYLSLTSLTILLGACGGGGNGGNEDGLPNALYTYSGERGDADVSNQTLAEDIMVSLSFSSQSNDLGGFLIAGANTNIESSRVGQNIIRDIIATKLKQDADTIISNITNDQMVSAFSQVMQGNCGDILGAPANGSATQKTVSQDNSKIVVDITYNNLCITDEVNPVYTAVLNGVMRMTINGTNLSNQAAQVTGTNLYMPNITATYTDLVSGDVFQDSFTMGMTITFEYDASGNPVGGTITIIGDVEFQGAVYRFRYFDDGVSLTGLDEFYHPSYGVVEYEVNLEFDTCGSVPFGTASVSNTTTDTGATFSSTDCSTYEVCLTNANGIVADPTDCTVYDW